jgi:hypothetical protein
MRDVFLFVIAMSIIGLLWAYLPILSKEHFSSEHSKSSICVPCVRDSLGSCILNQLQLQKKSQKKEMEKKLKKCLEQNDDPSLFALCLQQNKNLEPVQNCMPDLRKLLSASSASGDYKITPNYHMLLSQISPGDLANTFEKFSGFDPMGEKYGEPFENSEQQKGISCMSDPYGRCFDKYGTSAWQGYSQCILTGEGMSE